MAGKPKLLIDRKLAAGVAVSIVCAMLLPLIAGASKSGPRAPAHAHLSALQFATQLLEPLQVVAAALAIGCTVAMWWIRERRIRRHHEITRVLNTLAEEILEAPSPAEIVRKLNAVLPRIRRITAIRLYLHDAAASALRPVPVSGVAAASTVVNDGAALCFRNRTLVAIDDTRRSSFIRAPSGADVPRAAMFVPMFTRGETAGVLVMEDSRAAHDFSQEEQASAQHLANQIGASIRLQEQYAVRERLFRTEKQAAAGQLMSGVADELRAPLDTIRQFAERLRRRATYDADDVDELVLESHRAADIVRRLVALTETEAAEPQPLDLSAVISAILAYRTTESRSRGVELRYQLSSRQLMVSGSRGQLEQALVSLLVYGERCAVDARNKSVSVTTSRLASRVLVEIAWQNKPELAGSDPFEPTREKGGSLSLAVCRGIVQNHGGDVRFVRTSPTQARFDVELPFLETATTSPGAPPQAVRTRPLTVLLVGSDAPEHRELIRMLSESGDRAVPVGSAEEAIDLSERMRFDAVICAMRLPGLGWMDLLERLRGKVGEFIVLASSRKPDVARALRGSVKLLTVPLQKAELDRVLASAEERTADSSPRASA